MYIPIYLFIYIYMYIHVMLGSLWTYLGMMLQSFGDEFDMIVE